MVARKPINPQVYHNNQWYNAEAKSYVEGNWTDVKEINTWGEPILDKEVGAYTTWYDDPSNSIMLHYITVDGSPVECLIRKRGTQTWQTVPLYTDKPFPNTDKMVRWFKIDGLEADTLYETKLKYHKQVHKFKTMPSTFTREVKAVLLSDQVNIESQFKEDAPTGFQTIHDNNLDVILIAGDLVHDNGVRTSAWESFWGEYFKAERKNNFMLPMIVCLGNHDGIREGTTSPLLWNGTKENVVFAYNFFSNLNDLAYGTVDVGNYLSFIYLNTYHTAPIIGTQTEWLEDTLATRQDRTVFPILHVSPYPTYYPYTETVNMWTREYWSPLFTQYGVKIAGSGHEHAHLVTKKVTGDNLDDNGVVYTGQGLGMGNVTRGLEIPEDTWYADFVSVAEKGFDFITFSPNGEVSLNKTNLSGNTMYQKTL